MYKLCSYAALFGGFGSRRQHHNQTLDEQDDEVVTTSTSSTTTTTARRTTSRARTRPSVTESVVDASGNPIPSFTDVFAGISFLLMYCPAVFGHFGSAPIKTDRVVRIQSTNQVKVDLSSINQLTERFTIKVYAWLIDLIHHRKNGPTGVISGWVQKGIEHRGTKKYLSQT